MSPAVTGIHPAPTAEEAAAIVAAVDACWPRPVSAPAEADRSPAWRFSSRWWIRPVAARRERPW